MKNIYFIRFLFLSILLVGSNLGYSQIPATPSVQMLLTDNTGNPVADGSYFLTVSLYTTETGGTAAWSESQSVLVADGLANIIMGKSSPLTLNFNKPYFVGIKIGSAAELVPRLPMNPSTYSLSARAVYGDSNIFPAGGDVGIGTLTPQAKLDVEGKLRIANIPLVDNLAHVLVRDTLDDKIVKAMPIDSFLLGLNKVAWNFWWWGWPGNPGPIGPPGLNGKDGKDGKDGGVNIPGHDLIVKDSTGREVMHVNANTGESWHKGLEVFEKGISIGDSLGKGARVDISSSGKITIYGEDSTSTAIFYPDGRSWHKGLETFEGGVIIGNTDSTYLKISSDGTIQLLKGSWLGPSLLFKINPDGTSEHWGIENFHEGIEVSNGIPPFQSRTRITPQGDIQIIDIFGDTLISLNHDGTSYHSGLETFAGGIFIPTSTGGIKITKDGRIVIVDKNGYIVNEFYPGTGGGDSIASNTFKDGIYVLNAAGDTITAFDKDGSVHNGLETYKKGVVIGDINGAHVTIGEYGLITTYDYDGHMITQFSDNGSIHNMEEKFFGGVEIGDKESGLVQITRDGSIITSDKNGQIVSEFNTDGSIHNKEEHFYGGIYIGDPALGNVQIGVDGSIKTYDDNGDLVISFDKNGSLHKKLETYEAGIFIPTSTGGIKITPEGKIVIVDNDGNIVNEFLPGAGNGGTASNTFKDGIYVLNAAGDTITVFDKDGSVHNRLETYNEGLTVPIQNGGLLVISPDPEIGLAIFDGEGQFMHHLRPDGDAYHAGTLMANLKLFRIDHPLDPENKFLQHASVESNEMTNMYNGNIVLDSNGEGEVTMPDWFDALNKNFRYQLTPVGAPGPNLYIAEKVNNNKFKIAGGSNGLEVSWQVTGTRKDTWAIEHPLQVEINKSDVPSGQTILKSAGIGDSSLH